MPSAHPVGSGRPWPGGHTIQRLLEVSCAGCALLLAVQLPGALLDYSIRHDLGPPQFLVGVVVLLTATTLVLRRLTGGTWSIRVWQLGAAAVAFALAAVFAQVVAPAFMNQVFAEASDVGVLIPAPGSRRWDCRGEPRRCRDYVLNELGFRGSVARRSTPDARLVAFIGDSFIFGSGVGDEDTVPADTARNLSDLRPPVAVVNAGIQGLAAGSFPGVIRYVTARLHPDVFVVLFKEDDLDDTDILSRWGAFRRSFWFRLLYVTNVEPLYETSRQLWRYWRGQQGRRELLAHDLNAIADAAAGAKVLVLGAVAEDLQPVFSAWMAAHPQALHASASDDPRYSQAERIPNDGHWSEAGCAQIAAILTPLLRAELAPPAPS